MERVAYAVGEWVDFHGRLHVAGTGLLRGMITLRSVHSEADSTTANPYGGICFWFRPESLPRLELLRPGDCVHVTGQVASVTPFFMDICDCELLPLPQEKFV